MRCDDVTRELASPSGRLDPSDLAGHLASCANCAEWSRRASRLDRIWEATRPVEPSADALDALWAGASTEFDARPVPDTIRFEAPGRRRRATVAFALASAAAALLAAVALLRDETPDPSRVVAVVPPPVQAPSPPPAVVKVTVGVDQMAIVRIGDGGHRIEILDEAPLFASSSMADDTTHDRFNALESMASQ